MSDPQQAHQAVHQWAPVVSWLATVEHTITSAPEIGGVDADQISEAEDAVRAARMAVSALVGEYATESATATPQQPAPATAGGWQQPTSQGEPPRQQVAASRPSDQLAGQPGPQQHQQAPMPPQHVGGWQQ